jgi:hypothetical protein
MKFRLLVFLSIILVLNGCLGSGGPSRSKEAIIATDYKSIAILPFTVKFSADYKALPNQRQKSNWEDQERVAGLDLQKNAFIYFNERANKKEWEVSAQSLLQTNKILSDKKVPIFSIPEADKGALATILGVDAVLYGESEMEFEIQGFRRGMQTSLMLVDVSNNVLWKKTKYEDLNSGSTSPQDLALRSLNGLIKTLPFQSEK